MGQVSLASARYADSLSVFAGIVEIGLVGFAIIRTIEYLRRRLLAWHPETAKDVAA